MAKKYSSLQDLQNLSFPDPTLDEKSARAYVRRKGSPPAAPVKEKPKPAAAALPKAEPEADESGLFMAAMQGVDRMGGGQGRQIATPVTPPPPPQPSVKQDEEEALKRFLRGEIEFELEFSEEYMHGFVRGLDLKTFQMLKGGRLSHEAHLDLHGLNAEQAYDALLFFLRESYLQGRRCLLLVTGRGKNSPGGQSVLKQEIQSWLTREPLRRAVLAFCTALPKDGGAGALYVLLRRKRKEQGKVRFDTQSNFDVDW